MRNLKTYFSVASVLEVSVRSQNHSYKNSIVSLGSLPFVLKYITSLLASERSERDSIRGG